MLNSESFLSIKEPCHQDWENMDVSEKGKFCSSCKKHVHDFSDSTIDEVKKAFKESNGDLCGKVSGKILNQQYVELQTQRLHFSYSKTFCLALIICFGANLFTIQSTKATVLSKLKNKIFQIVSDTNNIVIKGVVTDKKTKEKLPFVNVVLMLGDSAIAATTSNIEGEYMLNADAGKYTKLNLKAIYIGYSSIIIKDILLTSDKFIDLDLEFSSQSIMGGIGSEAIYEIPLVDPFKSGKTISGDEYRRTPK